MMMSSQKLLDFPEILNKNIELFAKMIKYESIIKNITISIETEKYDAKRKLEALNNEGQDDPLNKTRSDWFSSGFTAFEKYYLQE